MHIFNTTQKIKSYYWQNPKNIDEWNHTLWDNPQISFNMVQHVTWKPELELWQS